MAAVIRFTQSAELGSLLKDTPIRLSEVERKLNGLFLDATVVQVVDEMASVTNTCFLFGVR